MVLVCKLKYVYMYLCRLYVNCICMHLVSTRMQYACMYVCMYVVFTQYICIFSILSSQEEVENKDMHVVCVYACVGICMCRKSYKAYQVFFSRGMFLSLLYDECWEICHLIIAVILVIFRVVMVLAIYQMTDNVADHVACIFQTLTC